MVSVFVTFQHCSGGSQLQVKLTQYDRNNSGPSLPCHALEIVVVLRKVAFILLIVCLSSMQIDRVRGAKIGTSLRKSHSSF